MALRRLAALAFILTTLSLAGCGGGGAAPTCSDGARNGDETAQDCGGPTCQPCADGLACAGGRDCRCAGGACAAPACNDLVRNGLETGVDCGGACAPCADGLACAVDGDCRSGRCAGQVCLKDLGAGCGGTGECASGHCVDGVCCPTACDGTCEACNLPGRFGHCDAVPDGEDPAGECAAEAPSSCGLDGACSGGRTCRRHAAGTACEPAACLDAATAQPGAACDGAGTCAAPAPIACSPLTCDGAAGACRTVCADSSQCAAGYGCAAGGGCLKLDGQACAADAECGSGFCTDGVCCGTRCDGACEACDQAGRAGSCDPVPAGQDPADECAATDAATCGTTGACSGSRSCAVWPGATACAAASCDSATVSRPASLCSGAGACQSQGTVDCAPLACDDATGLCRAACRDGVSGDCAPGYGCVAGACKKVQGAACAVDAECGSGFCTDGVCCGTRCDGACEACAQAGRAGSCDPVPAGQDPADECAATSAATCGTTGACSGARSCALHSSATTCAPPTCAVGSSVAARLCDGNGTCAPGATTPCGAYACDAATGLCRTTCSPGGGECAAGHDCFAGACKKIAGAACAVDAECGSGFCTDGVCCGTRCGGACEACDQAGRAGSCDPVPAGQDPANECAATSAATCGTTGACSGARSCALYSSATTCAPVTCAGGSSVAARLCDGNGTCAPGVPTSCGSYTCNAATGLCRTTCSVPGDCASGYDCFAGTCKRPTGSACAADVECGSGFCTDGVCCGTRCLGTCQACNLPGNAGSCTMLPSGTPAVAECPVDACHPGTCNGAGGCAVAADDTPCGTGGVCASGTCVDLNECTNGSATCDANATCTNTAPGYTCACKAGFLGDGFSCRRPVSCSELHSASPASPSGVYTIDPDGAGGLAEFAVSCDMVTAGGGWTVFQRRQDATDFDRTYAEYQAGFGSPAGSHWLGLDRLAALTTSARALRVELGSPTAVGTPPSLTATQTYSSFSVGPAAGGYVLAVSGPSDATKDSLTYHGGMAFTAKDHDADAYPEGNCASLLPGGWWFNYCHTAHLNGVYAPGSAPTGVAVIWATFGGLYHGLSFAEMKLR